VNEEQEGIRVAEGLLDAFGMDTLPIKPELVVLEINSASFKVEFIEQEFSENILGRAIGNERAAVISVRNSIAPRERYNFTLAHEIGHVCMHISFGKKSVFNCGESEFSSSSPHNDPYERQANGFASGLLMPRTLIKSITDGEMVWKNISTIGKQCGSSLEASYRRLSKLSRTPSAMIIHKNNGESFSRFIASDNFDFFIKREALSCDQKMLSVDIKIDRFPNSLETVDASDWIDPTKRGITLRTIYASTIALESGFLYTLLSYDDECIEEDDSQE
tara:strand:- start:2307 stop:3134 length:828 start_codon:yes stop_codon:yes gene_type:complete